MNVLSLFNGMSVGMMALQDLGIEVDNYYSAEIDKYANQATKAMFPEIMQLGDVTKWREWDIDWASIDLVTGGFPCQAWSMAGKQLGDKDERGMLFWTMLDIMKHVKYHNPKADFLIENYDATEFEGETIPAGTRRKRLKQAGGLNHKFVDMPEAEYNGLMDFFNTNMPIASHNLRLAHGLLQITQAAPIYIKEDGTATLPGEWMIKAQ